MSACVYCDAPGAHPGTRKCTDTHACDRRQEYARGVAEERARVVAALDALLAEAEMLPLSQEYIDGIECAVDHLKEGT